MKFMDKAIMLACEKHAGQIRKGDGQPFIFHPLEVMGIVSLMTNDEDILCAAILHDVLEDTKCTKEEVIESTNEHVAKLVSSESEDKRGQVNKEDTWKIRKQETIDEIKNTNEIGSKMICLADKISNLRALKRMQLTIGDKIWDRFNMKDPLMHYWYYNSLKEILENDLKDTSPFNEYCFLIDSLFGKYLEKGE